MRRQIVFFFHIFPQNFNLLFFLNPQLYINQIVHIKSWVKAIDARIPALIRNGVQEKQRSFSSLWVIKLVIITKLALFDDEC